MQDRLHNEVQTWAMSPVKYVQVAVKNSSVHLAANYGGKFRLPKKAENSFRMVYDQELGASSELDSDTVPYYLTVIGILR